MRTGWNPVRRNRNIGTARQGYGSDNRMVIPEPRQSVPPHWRPFWSVLARPVAVRRRIGGKDQLFLVEPPRSGWFYPCSIDDMVVVLAQCLPEDLQCFDFIVLRQPTRKQRMLLPAWGRAVFYVQIGRVQGSAIIIEAQSSSTWRWSESTSLSPAWRQELERLRSDGHRIMAGRRAITIESSAQAIRNTVLYRTLPHEIGHHVDYRRLADARLWDRRPGLEKESFAHRYAEHLIGRLRREGTIPFARLLDRDVAQREGLKAEWFDAGR